ncbi:MBL fold metallo-hydrolase [Kitasatospora phosalacinea]|uniref:MBL fold metallo-hydrolase n=1 Tax=Kitasatospora phosalacinea TaxID=2065 RepID=UPI0036653AE6
MRLDQNLYRIGNDIVAAYLVVTDEGVTLVDAGIPGQWSELLAQLSELGLGPTDVRGVVLTHGDGDHIGYAERLRSEFGVPVYIHAADAARARGEVKVKPNWGKFRIGATAGFLWYAGRRGGLNPVYLKEVKEIADGDVLDLPGRPRIVSLPGHSPGSVAVHVPAVDAVFVGDGLTTRHVLTGSHGPQPAPFTDDPSGALDSLDRLAGIEATWVLPGHGTPWNQGVQEIVRQVRAAAR